MLLVISSTPLNSQMQSTRIRRIGGESEIGVISVVTVAVVISEPAPDLSKVTVMGGKFVGTS